MPNSLRISPCELVLLNTIISLFGYLLNIADDALGAWAISSAVDCLRGHGVFIYRLIVGIHIIILAIHVIILVGISKAEIGRPLKRSLMLLECSGACKVSRPCVNACIAAGERSQAVHVSFPPRRTWVEKSLTTSFNTMRQPRDLRRLYDLEYRKRCSYGSCPC